MSEACEMTIQIRNRRPLARTVNVVDVVQYILASQKQNSYYSRSKRASLSIRGIGIGV